MRLSKQFKKAFMSVLASLVFATMMIADLKPVEAATTTITFSQSGGTSSKYSRDPSFSLEKDSSWITIKTSSPSDFTISASSNSTGKGRIGYVYVKRQGSVVTTYKIIQQGSTNLSVGPAKGSTSTYSKNSNQTVTTSCSWITLYKPNDYNVRMDYAANTTGSTRTGYVYVKEGSTIFTTYKITQSATVTVTYNKNGGSGSNFTRSIAYGSNYGKVDNPTKTGYNFTGWYTAASGGTQVTETTKMNNGANHTLYAHWSPKTFTVTFKDGSTTVSTKTVTYDSTYGDLPTRSVTGYTFNGWYTAASGGSKVTSSTKVTITANQTLYAQKTANSYTVTYNKNGGSGSNFTRTITYGSVYGKVDNPTRTGYDFTGWYTAASGGNQVVETTKMTTASNHTLYAHWSAKGYTVSFNGNGGSTPSAKTVYYDSTYGTLPSTSRTGYTFAGWYTAASGGSQITTSTKVAITANQTLYAHWTPKTFTVTLKDGSTTVSTKTVTYDSTYGDLPTRNVTGYTFNGWYTATSGGSKVTSSTKVTITANQTLYAQRTANSYTVTYDLNGGSGSNYTRTITYGSTYGKVGDPTRTGYEFHGWYTSKTYETQVVETTLMKTAANHTLYAKWTPKTFTVTLKDGSTTVSTKTVTHDGTYGDLPTRNVTGYTFNGWYTAASGGSKVTSSTKVTITANQTLYAQRTANSYTVTYDLNGGSGSNYTRTITYGSTYGKVGDPTRTGYEFHGWYTSKTYETQVVETTLMKTAANHTLYAKWTPKTFTVTLKDGSTTVSTKTVTYDGTYGDLPTRNVTGYTFNGWYTAASDGSKVTSSTKVTITANQILYAQRTANSYTVTYDLNGGSGSNYTRTITYGSTYGKVDNPTRTGYEFHGWYTSKTYETQVVETTLMKTAANHTLYAKWTPREYTIYFNSQGGSSVESKKVFYKDVYGTLPVPRKDDYSFDGWYTKAIGGTLITASSVVSVAGNQTLYAHWLGKYTVIFHDVPGTTDGTESVSYSVGEDFRVKYHYLNDEPFKWFRGWAKTRNAKTPDFVMYKNYSYTELISDENLADGDESNNVVHLYPVWTATQYTVRYEWPTGYQDVVHDSAKDFLTNGEFDPPSSIDGHYFIGWTPNNKSDTYVYTKENTIADVLPLMKYDESTLYAVYGYQGEAPSYILDSQYTNPVWADGTNLSIFIREDYIDQIVKEADNWSKDNSSSHTAYTNNYDMYKQLGCAINFTSSGHTLEEVYQELKNKIEEIDRKDLLYLEISILNTFDGVSLNGIYKNHVAPRHDGGKWYDLYYFSNSLSINNPARKVLIISFDPYIDVDGKKVRQHELIQSINDVANKPNEWWDPIDLAKKFAGTMEEVSYGNVKYIIDDKNIIILDEFPKDTSGNSYKGEDYLQTLKDAINWKNEYNAKHDEKKGWADYPFWLNFCRNSNCKKCEDPYDDAPYKVKDKDGKVIGDPYDVEPDYFTFDYDGYFKRFDVYNRVNSKEIDEVWIFIGPRVGLKAYESMMTGKDAFWINGQQMVKPGQRNYATFGFNFERGLGEMLEDAGHRMERTMDRIYGEPKYNKSYERYNDWEKFTAYDKVKPGKSGLGSIHYAPNSSEDYDWGNNKVVKSYYNAWLSYPDLSGGARQVECSEWGGDIIGHHKWWFKHIPHVNMRNGSTGKYNNWWWYYNFNDLQ